jgi:catechol 2,3-dioxygenase-like lactoylglutathione lyase family enzyme
MPVPKHIFDPPFNIIRSSHIALGVADLGRSRAFYAETLGLIVEDADRGILYLRGIEERQHHSLVLRHGEVPTAHCLGFKVACEEDLDKAARSFKAQGIEHAFVERPYQGRMLTAVDPYGMPSNFTLPWKSASDYFSAAVPIRACNRNASITLMSWHPTSRAASIFMPRSASGSPSMPRRIDLRATSRRPGCTARAMCTTLPSPMAGGRACAIWLIGCRRRCRSRTRDRDGTAFPMPSSSTFVARRASP